MKANELMIGDWLLFYDEDESQNIPVKIVGIDDDGWVFYEFPDGIREEGWCKKLYFIPITPEILEKNGFTKRFDDDLVLMECGRIVMEIGNNYTRFKDGKMYLRRVLAPLYYVHEFQHALRLCGIDKTIVL